VYTLQAWSFTDSTSIELVAHDLILLRMIGQYISYASVQCGTEQKALADCTKVRATCYVYSY
jgi:hypothetical protein